MSKVKQVLGRAKVNAVKLAAAAKMPPVEMVGHYYSPLTNPADAERAITWASSTKIPVGVNIDLAATAALAAELAPLWSDLDVSTGRYHRSLMFEAIDAAIYQSMLRHFRPARVLEVGSGYSTAVALDTIERFALDTRIECIEPNPERLLQLLREDDDVPLRQSFVQDVPLDVFDSLSAGDFLFIDSTHVAKAGSDVVWTTLRVLPRLKPGVIVHIHDMFWPLEYQARWLRGRRDWNEIYLIHAFLSGNPSWRVLLFNDQVLLDRPDLASKYFPDMPGHRPGGLWLERLPDKTSAPQQ
ncbi:class I SAM-dependent methyltransferase [uncultured Jatrophihabitans sp.]|uniref:class I SAM-dependent methyltransferase n=1 Tax=uncultured Jatrophihabitans sp. TaxID=1610747 RepID=UPI0035CBFEB9